MRAMVLEQIQGPLHLREVEVPVPGPGQVLLKVHACGVCRTDLHVVDGELADVRTPVVPGHQVVATVAARGRDVRRPEIGQRVGVPWLGYADGTCSYCRTGQENLCDAARFTGYQLPGGYSECMVAFAEFCLPIPEGYPDVEAAPLLCAGLIGFRALRMAGDAVRIGFYGFGSAAHILLQVARHRGQQVFALTRPGDVGSQDFAMDLGAAWAGDTVQGPPEPLDAALIFAPAGELVPAALKAVRKGGVVVCAGIHMSDIPSFPYELLWGERMVRSVANLTREDGRAFLELAPKVPVHSEVTIFPLEDLNEALDRLRRGALQGSAVIQISGC